MGLGIIPEDRIETRLWASVFQIRFCCEVGQKGCTLYDLNRLVCLYTGMQNGWQLFDSSRDVWVARGLECYLALPGLFDFPGLSFLNFV